MVFAVAALILQLAPGAIDAPIARTTLGITRAAEAGTSADVAVPPQDSSIPLKPESSSLTHYNFDRESLSAASTDPSTPRLSAVSLESSSDAQTLSNVRIPELQPGKTQEVTMAERRGYTRSWLALSLMQHGAATFDAYSTRQAISRGAVEDDPMMRPFAHSGVMYAAIQAGPVALDFIARRMQHSEFGVVRRMWWVPQTASTATFLFAGVHNLSVAAHH
jgi:hypothetical protein